MEETKNILGILCKAAATRLEKMAKATSRFKSSLLSTAAHMPQNTLCTLCIGTKCLVASGFINDTEKHSLCVLNHIHNISLVPGSASISTSFSILRQ